MKNQQLAYVEVWAPKRRQKEIENVKETVGNEEASFNPVYSIMS